MIDFHNHLLPGVDDGAQDLDETRAALLAMRESGVDTIVVTPHLTASTTERPAELAGALAEIDRAYAQVDALVAAEMPGLRLSRGVELMLDTPRPDLSDPRVRLGGTSFLLVEFPGMMVPPHSVNALYDLKVQGWTPIVAHPERYSGMRDPGIVQEWRSVGALLQVNTGSVLGRYGEQVQKLAWLLLRTGAAHYLSSDYHARGRLPLQEGQERIVRAGGAEQLRLLTEVNPARMLAGEPPEHVPPLLEPAPFWRRFLGRRR